MSSRLAPLVVALGLALVGCGNDDDDGSSRGSSQAEDTPARDDFIAQGDEVCRRANDQIAKVNTRIAQINQTATNPQQALHEAAPVLAKAYSLQRTYLTEFRGLTPPASDRATVDNIVSSVERQTATTGQLADAAAAGDLGRFQQVASRVAEARNLTRGLLRRYGFRVCGR